MGNEERAKTEELKVYGGDICKVSGNIKNIMSEMVRTVNTFTTEGIHGKAPVSYDKKFKTTQKKIDDYADMLNVKGKAVITSAENLETVDNNNAGE